MMNWGNQWVSKLICLLLAIVLWLFIMNEQNPMTDGTYTVPISIENLDNSFIATDVPKTITVQVKAPRNTMMKLTPSSFKAYVDLADVKEGEMKIPIHLEIPTGTELVSQDMKQANVRIDVYAVKEIPLAPQFSGRLDASTAVQKVEFQPAMITVSGAQRIINTIDKAVVPVSVQGKKEDFKFMASAHILDKNGEEVSGLTIVPRQVNVSVHMMQDAMKKTVPVHLVTYGEVASDKRFVQAVLAPAQIEVSGSKEVIDSLKHVNLPPIDLTGLNKTTEKTVEIPSMDGVVMTPNTITVRLEIE